MPKKEEGGKKNKRPFFSRRCAGVPRRRTAATAGVSLSSCDHFDTSRIGLVCRLISHLCTPTTHIVADSTALHAEEGDSCLSARSARKRERERAERAERASILPLNPASPGFVAACARRNHGGSSRQSTPAAPRLWGGGRAAQERGARESAEKEKAYCLVPCCSRFRTGAPLRRGPAPARTSFTDTPRPITARPRAARPNAGRGRDCSQIWKRRRRRCLSSQRSPPLPQLPRPSRRRPRKLKKNTPR